jgi:hypothetical protein
VSRFIESSLVVTIISSYTLKITVNIAHVTSHITPSNTSPGHTAVPLELRNSSEVNSRSRILSYPIARTMRRKHIPSLLHVADHIENSNVITNSPVNSRLLLPSYELYTLFQLLRDFKRKDVYRAVA